MYGGTACYNYIIATKIARYCCLTRALLHFCQSNVYDQVMRSNTNIPHSSPQRMSTLFHIMQSAATYFTLFGHRARAHRCKQLFCLKGHDEAIYSVKFSPDGTHMLTAGSDGKIIIWDLSCLTPGMYFVYKSARAHTHVHAQTHTLQNTNTWIRFQKHMDQVRLNLSCLSQDVETVMQFRTPFCLLLDMSNM